MENNKERIEAIKEVLVDIIKEANGGGGKMRSARLYEIALKAEKALDLMGVFPEPVPDTEDWIVIRDYPDYSINRKGIVRNDKKKFYLKNCYCKGYDAVYVSKGKWSDRKKEYLHRLIAIAFIPNPDGKPYINHKNGIRNDNRIENLEWVTHEENMNHVYDSGIYTLKLSNYQKKEIYELRKQGVTVKELAKKYGIHISTVYNYSTTKYE